MAKKKAKKSGSKRPPVKRDSKGRAMINWVGSSEVESQPDGSRVGFRKYLRLKHLRGVAEMATFSDISFQDDPSEAMDVFGRIGALLSQVIMAWDWVGEDGEPLPQPSANPEVFEELTFDELMWLIGQMAESVGSKN